MALPYPTYPVVPVPAPAPPAPTQDSEVDNPDRPPESSVPLGPSYSSVYRPYRAATASLPPHSLPSHSFQPRFASQPYSLPAYPPQSYSVPPPQSQPHHSAPPLFAYSSSQPPIASYITPESQLQPQPQPYPPYRRATPDELWYNESSAVHEAHSYPSGIQPQADIFEGPYQPIALPAAPYQNAVSHEDPRPPTTFQAASYQNLASQATKSSQPISSEDLLARVSVQDGEALQSFGSADALANYLTVFPEADNDQGCRAFSYGPNCPTNLLMPLFEHFDFPRFSMFPYGFADDFSIADHWGAGSCKCQSCMDGRLCGHYVLQKNFHFYLYQDVTAASSASPKITSTKDATIISTGGSKYNFRKADWNLQFFRFRARRLQTTVFAFDALVYQNYESEIKLKSSPLDYVLSQLDVILTNWDSVLNASLQFLSSFRVEILEERLETDRSIIRNLLMAAQHWEEFRRVLQTQLQRLEFFENVHGDPRWTEGHTNYYELLAVASGYLQRFRAVDHRITTELMQETNTLIQKVSNLITIDEGYRSRDQNESIRRLTWITFVFLPLIFIAGIFSMQVDLFSEPPAWRFYIYASLVLMFIVFFGYALLRSRRRVTRFLRSAAFWILTKCVKSLLHIIDTIRREKIYKKSNADLEKQPISSTDDIPTVLKWAASSGRTDVVRNILQASSKKTKLMPGMSGQALIMAIQNGHTEAANLLIKTGEGLSYTDEKNATVLHWAARMGQSAICQQLLEKGASPGAKDQNDQTALDWAIRGDDELTINLLLKGGKNFTRQETANLQSLHFSARTGDIDMIKEFHKQGSSLEARDGKGQTVLFHAVKGKQHDILQWLIVEGQANVQAVDREGLTALHVAAQSCDLKSAQILIDHSADVNALSSRNLTPLHCIPHSEGVRTLMRLHQEGADINAFDKDNERMTHKAARRGDSAALLVKVAKDLGADLEAPGAQDNAPAHLAAESGSTMILGFLSDVKVNFEKTRNSEGYTPLMMAARAGKVEVMRYLLEKGFSHDDLDSDGRSLIELTIGWGNPDVMSILQRFGADYSNVTATGGDVHPIWKAICEGQSASVAKILDGGLSIEYEHRGVRILQLAIEANNDDVVRLLIERGAAVDVADMRGWTALHSTAYSGNVHLLLLVLQKTDNLTPADHQGWTPLDLAAFYKHGEIMKLLDPEGKIKEFAWMKAGRLRINAIRYYHPPIVDSVVPGVAEASGHGK